MNLYSIDTLQFSKRMQKAGLQKEVADELAEAMKETHTNTIDNFATKTDLLGLATKADLVSEINSVRSEIKSEIKSVRFEIEMAKKDTIIKVGSMLCITVGILAAVIKL